MNPMRGGESIIRQLVAPLKYRERIIEKAHKDIFSTHLGISCTKQRIVQNFYWPGMGKQVKLYSIVRAVTPAKDRVLGMTRPRLSCAHCQSSQSLFND